MLLLHAAFSPYTARRTCRQPFPSTDFYPKELCDHLFSHHRRRRHLFDHRFTARANSSLRQADGQRRAHSASHEPEGACATSCAQGARSARHLAGSRCARRPRSACSRGSGMIGTMGAAAVGAVAGTMAGSALAGGMSSDKDAKAKEAEALTAEKEAKELQLKADETKLKAEAARATVK